MNASVAIVDIRTNDTKCHEESYPSKWDPELSEIIPDEHADYYKKYYNPDIIHDVSFGLC